MTAWLERLAPVAATALLLWGCGGSEGQSPPPAASKAARPERSALPLPSKPHAEPQTTSPPPQSSATGVTELRRKATAICAPVTSKITGAFLQATTLPQIGKAAVTGESAVNRALARSRRLSPSPTVAPSFHAFLRLVAQLRPVFMKTEKAAAAGNGVAIGASAQELIRLRAQIAEAADRLGVPGCATG